MFNSGASTVHCTWQITLSPLAVGSHIENAVRYLTFKQPIAVLYSINSTDSNSPVSPKLKYLWNINNHQLTEVAQHPGAVWKPYNVQKPMGPETLITMSAQTVPNFSIIRMK